jgi:ribose-phosphate pyrophosphokinase
VVILDDIISTGGTQATAAMMLYEQGARSIHTVGIHGVLASGAYTRLISAGIASISCSDTVERACSTYSAAKVLAEYL